VSRTRAITDAEELRPSVQRYHLVVLRGPELGRTHEVRVGRTVVGKGEDADLRIPDATVSRAHFEVVGDADGFRLRDLGSTNGTWLEDARIKEAYLRPGARIKAGEVLLRFVPVSAAVEAPSRADRFGALVSNSDRSREIFALLQKVAPTPATVLLVGETGTGKSETARQIHAASPRARAPFVVFDCGAVSKSLIESELFGHEKGAFTGATQTRRGALEAAEGGTVFIDELDDLPLEVQPKLLRALDERVVYRVGSHRPLELDVRVVAATKKDLRHEVAAGRFREDLYFRLSVVIVPLPPLRARIEDVPLLVDHFLEREGAWAELPAALRERLVSHTWPGNLRELRNVLERSAITGALDAFDPGSFRPPEPESSARLLADWSRPFKEAKELLVARFEREYLKHLLIRSEGNMARAARDAGIDRKYLYMLMKKHELAPGEIPSEEA
jgi:DNA-binding NtrC family response regulator